MSGGEDGGGGRDIALNCSGEFAFALSIGIAINSAGCSRLLRWVCFFPRSEVICRRRAPVPGHDDNFALFTGARVIDPMPDAITAPPKTRRNLRDGFWWVVFALVALAAVPAFTGFGTTAERTLYFKLPIQGVEFHWMFLDSAAFLSGELTLRIINKDRDDTLVVFRDGKIQDGWEVIADENEKPHKEVYFGFATSTRRFRTAADDSLIVTLKAPKDLLGRGPESEGVLAAGVWQMSGSYSSIYGGRWHFIDLIVRHGEPPVAFMNCWTGVWPITITKREGWMGAAPLKQDSTLRKLFKSRGTNGRPCGSFV